MRKKVNEFSVVGNEIEEHFNSKSEAKQYFNSLTEKERSEVQFFRKTWIETDTCYIEDDCILFSSYCADKLR